MGEGTGSGVSEDWGVWELSPVVCWSPCPHRFHLRRRGHSLAVESSPGPPLPVSYAKMDIFYMDDRRMPHSPPPRPSAANIY